MIATPKCKNVFAVILLMTIGLLPLLTNAQSQTLAGYYRTKANSCNLSIRITQSGGQYLYTLKIDGHAQKGKLKTTGADEPGAVGIIFTGTKWAEYSSKQKPTGIEGVWNAGAITIQNYGNSMNYYTQIAGCGEKYIELTRQ